MPKYEVHLLDTKSESQTILGFSLLSCLFYAIDIWFFGASLSILWVLSLIVPVLICLLFKNHIELFLFPLALTVIYDIFSIFPLSLLSIPVVILVILKIAMLGMIFLSLYQNIPLKPLSALITTAFVLDLLFGILYGILTFALSDSLSLSTVLLGSLLCMVRNFMEFIYFVCLSAMLPAKRRRHRFQNINILSLFLVALLSIAIAFASLAISNFINIT